MPAGLEGVDMQTTRGAGRAFAMCRPCRAAVLLALACPVAWPHAPDPAASAPDSAHRVCKTPPPKPAPPKPQPPRAAPEPCPAAAAPTGPILVINEAPATERQRSLPPEVLAAREALRAQAARVGGLTAAILGALGLVLVALGLLFGARGSISFEGNAGGFGGRAWGWRLSPPLAMLIGGGAALLLAVVIVGQFVQLGLAPPAADEAAPASSKRAASGAPT
jgi:hypothetical protein